MQELNMKIHLNEDLSIDCVVDNDFPNPDGWQLISVTDEQAQRALSIDYNTRLWQWKNNDVVESEFRQKVLDDAYNYEQSLLRAEAYPTISDPVFFQYQRGQKAEQDWLDAVQRVKDMYPYRGE